MKAKKPASRFARTIRALLIICAVGIVLGAYSSYIARRDTALATGPESAAQKQFFVDASERPDLADFFKSLKHDQRVAMGTNIGRYTDPSYAKLIGTCLADFDADARAALTKSLARQAVENPGPVAEQLKLSGSFQKFGVMQALRAAGAKAIPEVVKQLSVGDARGNAVEYLVGVGKPAVDLCIAQLGNKENDVRQAAADTLGKIGDPKAVQALTEKFSSSPESEQTGYLSALASIASPDSEGLFEQQLTDEDLALTRRAIAALGIGKVGNAKGVKLLWALADHPDKDFAAQILSALQLAGDVALQQPATDPIIRIRVAASVDTPLSDSIIRKGLPLAVAARAAQNRPSLVADLKRALTQLDPTKQGDQVDALVAALSSTDQGSAVLKELAKAPAFEGFVERRTRMSQG